MEPALEPLGLDWRVGIGILGAFSAREVFVSTLGIVFDISDADETNQPLRDKLGAATRADGTRLFTPASGVALMVFFVLACQCMSTVAVVRRESGSWRWPLFMFGYQTVLAYVSCAGGVPGGPRRWASARDRHGLAGHRGRPHRLRRRGFLLRRVVGRRRRKATAQSFVPLSSLKKRNAASRDDGPPVTDRPASGSPPRLERRHRRRRTVAGREPHDDADGWTRRRATPLGRSPRRTGPVAPG